MHPRLCRSRSGLVRAALVSAAIAPFVLCGQVSAQVEILPTSLVQSSTLGGDARDQIERYVTRHAPGLTSDDFDRIKRSRDALLDPLTKPAVSVAFRQAYGSAVWASVQPLIESEDATAQLTGMRIAGALATDTAASALIAKVDSGDEGVRIFAVGRLEGILRTSDSSTPPISANTGQRIVDRLCRVIEEDPQVLVVDAAIRAVEPATRMNPAVLGGLRQHAIEALAEHTGLRLRALASDAPGAGQEMSAAIRSCAMVRNAIADAQGRPTVPMTLETIGVGGDALAYVIKRRQARPNPGEAELAIQIALVSAGETAIYFGRLRHAELVTGQARPTTTSFADLLSAGDERAFRNAVIQHLQKLENDYSFAARRFTGS